MITRQRIEDLKLVLVAQKNGQRDSTYDATVGHIVVRGKIISEHTFKLKPRHIAWIISEESFNLPDNITGLATLRTKWTHGGVLALNVGIVDPGWVGPLGTIIVNLSKEDFYVKKGDSFLRLLFHEHQSTGASKNLKTTTDYIKDIELRSKLFASTFLDFESLAGDVEKRIFQLPKWAIIAAFVAIVFGALAIFAPVAWEFWSGYEKNNAQFSAELDALKKQVKSLQEEKRTAPVVEQVQGKSESPPPHATGKDEN